MRPTTLKRSRPSENSIRDDLFGPLLPALVAAKPLLVQQPAGLGRADRRPGFVRRACSSLVVCRPAAPLAASVPVDAASRGRGHPPPPRLAQAPRPVVRLRGSTRRPPKPLRTSAPLCVLHPAHLPFCLPVLVGP